MNQQSIKQLSDQREPEKTPLIDIIFLLLIFFFVSISTQSYEQEAEMPVENKAAEDLMKLEDAVPVKEDIKPNSLLLIQIVDMSRQSDNYCNVLNNNLHDLRLLCSQVGVGNCPDLTFKCDETSEPLIVIKPIEEWAQEIQDIMNTSPPSAADRPALQRLAMQTPMPVTDINRASVAIQTVYPWVLNYESMIHLRIGSTVPVRTIEYMYNLMEQLNISEKNIHIRVLTKGSA